MWSALSNGTRPELASRDHAAWRELILTRCGLDFGETRGGYLSRRLWQRMQPRGITAYDDYFRRVAFGAEGRHEWQELVELLVNRETSFFRHPPSFDALARVLPELLAARARQGVRVLRLWSAGCSTGQEAYSMAMCASEAVAAADGSWEIRLTGSDISRVSREAAQRGRYPARRIEAIPEPFRRRYMTEETGGETSRQRRASATTSRRGASGTSPRGGANGTTSRRRANGTSPRREVNGTTPYKVGERLRSMTRFRPWNMVEPESYEATSQDVIFCQNLLVYQRPAERREVVDRFCRRLQPGGYLFLAPGEVVGLKLPGVRLARLESCLAYQRIP